MNKVADYFFGDYCNKSVCHPDTCSNCTSKETTKYSDYAFKNGYENATEKYKLVLKEINYLAGYGLNREIIKKIKEVME